MITDKSLGVPIQDSTICVIGLGYVGLTLAVTLVDVGFQVYGVELRESVLGPLKKGTAHFFEPGLESLIQHGIDSGRFQFGKEIPEGLNASVYVITVGTPLNENQEPRMEMLEAATKAIAARMPEGSLVIPRSTVVIGTTRKLVYPILTDSGKKFDLAFCPERTLEGSALQELRRLPQIIGGMTEKAGLRAATLFQMLTPTVVRTSNPETAEMIKLIDNTQRDVAFAYANEVAYMCNALSINADEVISAGRLGYPRTNLYSPGPVGGPCLEKDSHILAKSLEGLSCRPNITLAARNTNERLPEEIKSYLAKATRSVEDFPKNAKISLLGLAFKGYPETDDLRGTIAKPIFTALRDLFPTASFYGYDAVVKAQDISEFGVTPCASLEEAFSNSNLVLILNNHAALRAMTIESLSAKMSQPGFIYDCWNIFGSRTLYLPPNIIYTALGNHGQPIRGTAASSLKAWKSNEIYQAKEMRF